MKKLTLFSIVIMDVFLIGAALTIASVTNTLTGGTLGSFVNQPWSATFANGTRVDISREVFVPYPPQFTLGIILVFTGALLGFDCLLLGASSWAVQLNKAVNGRIRFQVNRKLSDEEIDNAVAWFRLRIEYLSDHADIKEKT